MLPKIGRTLVLYREAFVWYLLVGAAVTTMVLAGPPSAHPLPAQPQALPPLRTVGQPPPPPPPITIPPTTLAPPTTTLPSTSAPSSTRPETRPEQVGADDQPPAQPPATPPPPTTVPPIRPPPETTVTTAPPTTTATTVRPRNKAIGLPAADDMADRGICLVTVDKGTLIQRPCPLR